MKINFDSKKLSSLQLSELHYLAHKLEKAIAITWEHFDFEYYKKRDKSLKEQEKLEYIKEQSKENIIDRYNFYKEYIR